MNGFNVRPVRNSKNLTCALLLSAGALSLSTTCLMTTSRAAAQAAPGTPAAPLAAVASPSASTAPGNAGPLIVGGIDEKTGGLQLLVNKSKTLLTSRPYKRVSTPNEDV